MVQCRLDRSLTNSKWSNLFPSCRCQYLKFEGSDHKPVVSFLDTTKQKGTRIFRYDRRLRDNQEVKEIIKQTWEGYPHLSVEARLSLCRKAICRWSKQFQENSRKTLESRKERLDTEMTNPTSNEELIQHLNGELLIYYKKEEESWKQRSRQLWLTLGDANTSYFHAATKGRRARNRLSVLEDERGIPCFEEDQISSVICNFYSELFTSSYTNGSQTVNEALKPCIHNR